MLYDKIRLNTFRRILLFGKGIGDRRKAGSREPETANAGSDILVMYKDLRYVYSVVEGHS